MCIHAKNPTLQNDGLHPYETIFVKYSNAFQDTKNYHIAKRISIVMSFEDVF